MSDCYSFTIYTGVCMNMSNDMSEYVNFNKNKYKGRYTAFPFPTSLLDNQGKYVKHAI